MQSPPQTHEPPERTATQTPAEEQDPLLQSALDMQGPVAQFVLQVPPWQFWLVQSPPQPQAPDGDGLTSHVLLAPQKPLVQSVSHSHGGIESAHTGAQTPGDPPLRSQN